MAGPKVGPAVAADVDPATADVAVGGYVCSSGSITFDADRPVTTLTVRNSGDRPIQVGSHFHFFEVNRALEFDRPAAFGLHLNIPSSTAMRFEPGDEREVQLVPYGGKRAVYGFNNLVDGPTAGKDAATAQVQGGGAGGAARLSLVVSARSELGELFRHHSSSDVSRKGSSWRPSHDKSTSAFSVPRPAIASAWAIPGCSSRSSAICAAATATRSSSAAARACAKAWVWTTR